MTELSASSEKNFAPAAGTARLRLRAVVSAFYFMQGIVFGSWASRIPDVKASLGMSEAELLADQFVELFCRKNIWNQGKASRAQVFERADILPKEHLESRQSLCCFSCVFPLILPKEHLESRQSREMHSRRSADVAFLRKERREIPSSASFLIRRFRRLSLLENKKLTR